MKELFADAMRIDSSTIYWINECDKVVHRGSNG